MDFKNYLDKAARELDREVGKILEEQLSEAKETDKKLTPLIKAFTGSCQGGKRIRGALVVLGYQLTEHLRGVSLDFTRDKQVHLGGEIIKVGAAYEILHTAILVHDDIIDQSALRRGQPSLHIALGKGHYGISQAISLGDWGFFLAIRIIAGTAFSEKSKIKALELFTKVMMDTAWGEMLDLEKTDPMTVMRLKTARYTIAGPLQLGVILAGGNQKLVKTLGDFGENLGIAFQIRDDILDAEAKVKGVTEKVAERYKNKALKVLPEITKERKMSKLLQQLAEYLVQRNK